VAEAGALSAIVMIAPGLLAEAPAAVRDPAPQRPNP
jgi:hypothetical protein